MADPSQSDPGDATGTKEINSYSYSPLRVVTSKNTFRLLILMPEVEKNSPIKCTLTQELIENEPEYEALSYVWSALPGRSAIQVNNRTFFATKNLEAALRTLRRQKSVRILWIDAICINQDDQIEKQKQVQMMGEIYSKATKVIMWLGNETNAASKTFKFFEWLLEKSDDRFFTDLDLVNMFIIYSPSTLIKGIRKDVPYLDHHLECVATILSNPYWSRIWVVQEVVLARLAIVTCGSLAMEWSQFCSCVQKAWKYWRIMSVNTSLPFNENSYGYSSTAEEEWIRSKADISIFGAVPQTGDDGYKFSGQSMDPTRLPRTLRMLNMSYIRKRRVEQHPLKLPTLLQATSDYESTKKCDKVYGILGMADVSDLKAPIIPDYTISYAEVCTQLAVNFLLSRKDLAILEDLDDPVTRTLSKLPARDTDLPSWVPDFGETSSLRSIGDQNWKIDQHNEIRDCSNDRETNMSDSDPTQCRDFDASAHPVSRFPYTFSPDFKIFNLRGIVFDTVKERSCSLKDMASESRRLCLLQWQGLVKAMLDDEYPRGGTYKEAYERTRICNIIRPLPTRPDYRRLIPLIFQNPHIPLAGKDAQKDERLLKLMSSWIRDDAPQMLHRTMFMTRSGLLGLGPASMQPGDTLAVLMGGRVPMVLRETNGCFKHDKTESGIHYRVIGESYVHGVMQGEIVREQEAGAFKLEEFHLV